jgi:hypothetical protein
VIVVSNAKLDRILETRNEGGDKSTRNLENQQYQDVKVKSNKSKEESLFVSASKNLPTEGDETRNASEELPSVTTEGLRTKPVKVFENVQNKSEKDKKKKTDNLNEVIKMKSISEEDEDQTKPIKGQHRSGS